MAEANREEIYKIENREWLESLEWIVREEGPERVRDLLRTLQVRAQEHGITFACPGNTPYVNTIPKEKERPYPGKRDIERRIKSIIRWNAMAMVVRANRDSSGIGGHISTYASSATILEVAFNHFLRGEDHEDGPDLVYFQGHASPGVYARSFVEGRLTEEDLINFRQELRPNGGLSSYPHPRSMPEYWQFPTVSMGLASIQAIYQARFMQYLQDNGVKKFGSQKVWAFLGDGEFDEPESMGALTVASREMLGNLIFVINCNLQRLDGPVRGNGKIVQELEAAFRGAGWRVIKVLWGDDWDPLFEKDDEGLLARLLDELPDGQMQKYSVAGGDYIRNDLFGKDQRLLKIVENYSDDQLAKLRRGGHDPQKVYNAFAMAVEGDFRPSVVLAQTIKGYGLGEAGEGKNITHQQKKLNEQELRYFRGRFSIPISDEQLQETPFYKMDEASEEYKYLMERRKELGGFLPKRNSKAESLDITDKKMFDEFFEGSGDREVATTMVSVQILGKLLKDKKIGDRIVPIVPDESRTFGMEALFRTAGIYSHQGQQYEPVDKESLLYYKEDKSGAILEEGITEAGCMSSFIAAGTSYSSFGIQMVPFFFFYSMFGFQRIGDLIWAAGDSRARGFMIGGTSGRTTLPGEGLQHADGQSHIYALSIPSLKAYDPAFAYEAAVIIREGFKRMFTDQEDLIYYITVTNDTYPMPEKPKDAEEGILKGMYRYLDTGKKKPKARLLASGAIVNEAVKAKKLLEEEYDVPAEVWSVTSFKELYHDCTGTERANLLNPGKDKKKNYIEESFGDGETVFVAATDYMKSLPLSVSKWFPGETMVLGTDGYGRSDNRGALRDHFEVDHRYMTVGALHLLQEKGEIDGKTVDEARKKLNIDPDKMDPMDL